MTRRVGSMSDEELAAALGELAERIEWPPAPEVTAAVTDELRRRERHPVPLPRSGGRLRWSRPLLLAAALLVPVAGTAIAAGLLWDFGAIEVDILPRPSTPLPSTALQPEALGTRVPLGEVTEVLGFAPLLPGPLGPPDQVWVSGSADLDPRLALTWLPRKDLPRIPGTPWGAVLFEIPGDSALIAKSVFAENLVTPAVVDGAEAVWARGEHALQLRSDVGATPYLVTGNVLLWNERAFAMRFESLLDMNDAVRIAQEIDVPS